MRFLIPLSPGDRFQVLAGPKKNPFEGKLTLSSLADFVAHLAL